MFALLATVLIAQTQGVIQRDAFGVPHVEAPSVAEAFRLAGYAVAQDRIAQMDMSRRSARGRLAEVLGQRGVASDKDALRFGYTDQEYATLLASLPKLTSAALTSYSAGINQHVREKGLSLRDWEPTDSLAIGVNLVRRFGRGGAGEIRNLLLYTYLTDRLKGDTKKAFDDLLWQNDEKSPTTVSNADDPAKGKSPFPKMEAGAWERHVSLLPKVNIFELLPAIRIEQQSELTELAVELGVPNKWGSYAILVDGTRALNPTLMNGPQMGFSLPSVVHQMSINAPGYKAIGMDIPGFPGIVVGRTDESAWGATSGVADTDDIYFVELNPDDPTQYRYKGEWMKFDITDFAISVQGGEQQKVTREMSVYGPVILKSVGTGVAYVRKSTLWMNEVRALSAIVEHVANGEIDFTGLAAGIPASFNLFGLGKDISWNYCGDVPIRTSKLDPRLPMPGTGEFDWAGLVKKPDMPHLANPKSGTIANWNNKPVSWWPNFDTPIWGEVFRNTAIEGRLGNLKQIRPLDIDRILREIAIEDTDALSLLPIFVPALNTATEYDGLTKHAARIVAAWDAMAVEGTAAPLIYSRFYDQLRRDLFEPELGGMLNPSVFFLATQASVTLKALRGETAIDYLAGRSKEEVVQTAFAKAVESLKSSMGDNISTWHAAPDTIKWQGLSQVPYSNRGTYIQIVERWPTGLSGKYMAPPGSSEDTQSPHYSDQVIKAASWTYLPMQFPAKNVVGSRD
ncbi:MAG: penicillin acylase family protein [Armatimonadota bacterium]|nr:penicillin acylase family protein [Armatimonadota bacterium]